MSLLTVAINPGGIRALNPVIERISPLIFTIPSSQKYFSKDSFQIDPEMKLEDVRWLMEDIHPELLLTGTSLPQTEGGHLENLFRKIALEQGIPSVSVLDHWANYSGRFTDLPHAICVMDRRAAEEMVHEGFDPSIIHVTGQPAFDRWVNFDKSDLRRRKEIIRKKLSIPAKMPIIGFASEPILNDHGSIRGYDEINVYGLIKRILHKINLPHLLVVKTHPRESSARWMELIHGSDHFLGTNLSTEDFLSACDIVIGMTSILLTEASLLKIPTFSFQPNTVLGSPWGQAMKSFSVITTKEVLFNSLQKLLMYGVAPQPTHYTEAQATQKVINIISSFTKETYEDTFFGISGNIAHPVS